MELILKPHYLLKIRSMEDLVADLPFPEWAQASLIRAPFVVVRRAEMRQGMIPVGIRGAQRGQRMACWLPEGLVQEVITPFSLTEERNWKAAYDLSPPETIRSLRHVIQLMKNMGFKWGPTGSTGFELATGMPTLKESSDLDLLIEVPEILSVKTAKNLLDRMEDISTVRLDVQINTAKGGVAMKEYAASAKVLIKTAAGPVLEDAAKLWD